MQKIRFKISGKIAEVENNVAHGFIERGLATLITKEIEESPKNKMITAKDKRLKRK